MGNAQNLLAYLTAGEQARAKGPAKPVAPVHPVTNPWAHAANIANSQGSGGKGAFFLPNTSHLAPPPAAHHGLSWGSVGGFLHNTAASLGAAGHDTAHAFDQASHDIAAMPTGVAAGAEALYHATKDQVTGHPDKAWKIEKSVGKATADQTYQSVRHPGRDPFQFLLTAGALASLGAGAGLRGAAAADALSNAGEGASALDRLSAAGRAAATKPEMPERILNIKTLKRDSKGSLNPVQQQIRLVQSHKPIARAFQALHDSIIERSLNKHDFNPNPSIINRYAAKRVAGAVDETQRIADRVRMTLPFTLDKIRKFDKPLSLHEGHLALFLRSANVLPSEARNFWAQASDHLDQPEFAQHLAQLAHNLDQKGVLGLRDGKVVVNKGMYPKLHAVDTMVKDAQKERAAVIEKHGLLSPEAMHERLNLVAKTMGVNREGQGYTSLAISRKAMTPYPRAGSVPVTGKVRNFIAKTKIATGKGVAKGLIPDNTVAGVSHSLREAYAYLRKTQHRAAIARFGSDVRRTPEDVLVADTKAARHGKIDTATRQAVGQEESTLNTLNSKDYNASQQHEVGVAAGIHAAIVDQLPHLDESGLHPYGPDWQAKTDLGQEAPKGYKWVHKDMLGDLAKSVQPRSKWVKRVDNINSAVTAATVYLKLSHIPQRAITDATTSAVSGALFSRKSWQFAKELKASMNDKQFLEAAQSTGTHGYSALPHEGEGAMARLAGGGIQVKGRTIAPGADQYASHIDAPFRFLNLAHEARKAGIDTPQEFKKMLEWAKNPERKFKNAGKYEHVLKRSNRVSMMYDGMSARERATIARAMWFYPWTKAAARFGAHTIAEHPLTAAVGANLGAAGRRIQKKELGALPSFEYGLVPFSHGHLTSNAGYLWPYNTTSNVAELGARPEQIIQNLNPVYGAGLTAISGLNQFGEKQGHPIGTALSELAGPAPEFGILNDFLHAREAERKSRMFPHSPAEDFLTRFLVGPTYPKQTTKKALHFAHKKESDLLKTIYIKK